MTNDFAMWLAELQEPVRQPAAHYKYTGSTTVCGINVHQSDSVVIAYEHKNVTCHHCIIQIERVQAWTPKESDPK